MRDYNAELLNAGFMVDGRSSLPRNYAKEWPTRAPSVLKGAVFHQSLDDYGTAHGNARYHSGPNHISRDGLPGLSYTIFVEPYEGRAVLANDVESVTYSQGNPAIAGNENVRFLGVCFGGNFAGPGYTPGKIMKLTNAQLEIMYLLWIHLMEIFGFEGNQLFGHYHFGKPACPGYEIAEFIEATRAAFYNEDLTGGLDLLDNKGRQTLLAKLGFYHAEIDGQWGPQSKYALAQCQAMLGLEPDSVWSAKTEALMLAELD